MVSTCMQRSEALASEIADRTRAVKRRTRAVKRRAFRRVLFDPV